MGARLEAVETRRKSYLRRRRENTVLYRVLQQNIETFLADLDAADQRLPAFVERELRAFLACGIHALGFVRLRCKGCRKAVR